MYLLCRNRVRDFATWKAVFDEHAESAHADAGLRLVNLWHAVDDRNNVFFLFEIDSIERAEAFMATPEAAEAGQRSGVIDGEYHFLKLA
jgi:hypothetical protein